MDIPLHAEQTAKPLLPKAALPPLQTSADCLLYYACSSHIPRRSPATVFGGYVTQPWADVPTAMGAPCDLVSARPSATAPAARTIWWAAAYQHSIALGSAKDSVGIARPLDACRSQTEARHARKHRAHQGARSRVRAPYTHYRSRGAQGTTRTGPRNANRTGHAGRSRHQAGRLGPCSRTLAEPMAAHGKQ